MFLLTFARMQDSFVTCERRQADVLGVDRQTGGGNVFTGRHRTSYTFE